MARRRFPEWLRKRVPAPGAVEPVQDLLRELKLATVCQSAHCPNQCECFARGTATFMILGRICTRNCTFCAVERGTPTIPEADEPGRIAEAVRRLDLRHVVVTSVTRDDLSDGGSSHFAATIKAVHEGSRATIEVLVPDFQGRERDVMRVLDAGPEVFNHNVETVPRLYSRVRPMADFKRSLSVLAQAASREDAVVKSGMMLGLGEREEEVTETMRALRDNGCHVLTLGQYLAPSAAHHEVVEFVTPRQFADYRSKALDMGFEAVASGPFVRSSYGAAALAEELMEARKHHEPSLPNSQE